jgi:hypothetical protein
MLPTISIEEAQATLPDLISKLRGYPQTFSRCRSEIKQPPCGNETQGDRRGRAYSA